MNLKTKKLHENRVVGSYLHVKSINQYINSSQKEKEKE